MTTRTFTLRICYYGCRHHPPRDRDGNFKQRPCPAKSLQGQLKRRGFWASQYQGTVRTDAPREVLEKLRRT